MDNELPAGERTRGYRFLEMLPALLSYGTLLGLVVISFFSPVVAACGLLVIVLMMLFKAVRSGTEMMIGNARMESAEDVDWAQRLALLERPEAAVIDEPRGAFQLRRHQRNLAAAAANPGLFPKPSQLRNAVIVAAYNEPYEVIAPTFQALADTTYDNDRLIVLFAYEERGGQGMELTAKRVQREFGDRFGHFELVRHPAELLPGEMAGKGANITFAGRRLQQIVDESGLEYSDVVVTTLDCDNVPFPSYFDYVSYEYIVHPERKRMSFQPISLFLGNIWDAPAPSRVIANGNTFWNLISSMRPLSLRNFASHSQPLDALVEMDFWSTRTIVEDGHQYWRSYFHFNGDYKVISIHVPIYQDAVLTETYGRTIKAQFKQLKRWSYGASDVPYVGVRVFGRTAGTPLLKDMVRFVQLLDSHVSLACIAPLIAFGAWIPFVMSMRAEFMDTLVLKLPFIVGTVQQVALLGILLMMWLGFNMLPKRPARYGRMRSFGMILQWVLMPVTGIVFNSLSALTSQTQLLLGHYRESFDVTEKATHASMATHAAPQTQSIDISKITARAA
ncbi:MULTISPECIES: glycosyltransferase [unclassified Pseudoclavibacter]|uniref:glycosyltransferase n=1 Tax=unclassified Pseudoclavibacter TaxID=2615177 RepID=UPI001787AB32|nr:MULTISPECIES: glycosyltransferase family 2 protein [unclassified Pseudoclavibacter]